ncbi:hypothetical protein [Halostella litorea]|uniref:hypothetical protein n=1 Tax=Halostella litorea TaxID=2528831 RepID=UPI00109238A2|nr:hypothetical protein [Halostella litorea]
MTRRVPELALVVGLVLSGSFVAAVVALEPGFLADPASLLVTVAIAVAVLYPFAGFAAVRMDDPTWLLPPDPLLALSLVAAAGVALLGAVGASASVALAVAVLVAGPPAAYNASHGGRLRSLRPARALGGGTVAGVAVFGLGAATGANPLVYGLVAAALLLLGGAYYTDRVPGRRAERRAGAVVSAGFAACAAEYALFAL